MTLMLLLSLHLIIGIVCKWLMLLRPEKMYMSKNRLETPFGNAKLWLQLLKSISALYRLGSGNVANNISEMRWILFIAENWGKYVLLRLGLIKVG
ncbi:hypothetical protein D3C73_680870 [compost metagenome]